MKIIAVVLLPFIIQPDYFCHEIIFTENAVKSKTKDEETPKRLTPGFTSTRRKGLTLLDLFASEQPRAALDEPETSPSREALGFGTKPMSFMTNFKRELPFDGTKKIRVKRSRLPPLDLDAAASAQRGGIGN